MAEPNGPLPAEPYGRLRRLRIRASREVRTWLGGSYASAFRGPGVEFAELRRYQPGDDVRRIDWQVTARRREPYVRRHVEERELRVIIAMDVSASMGRFGAAPSKRTSAGELAAMLAVSAARNGDRVGGLLFGSHVVSSIPPRRSERHAMQVVRLAASAGAHSALTDLRPVLDRLRRLHGHVVAFLLSDFVADPPLWEPEPRRLLAACARKHDVLAVWLQGRDPSSFPGGFAVTTEDPESGRGLIVPAFGRALSFTQEAAERHRLLTGQALQRCTVPTMELKPGEPYVSKLMRLLAERRSRRAR